jgi:hypothetical protein
MAGCPNWSSIRPDSRMPGSCKPVAARRCTVQWHRRPMAHLAHRVLPQAWPVNTFYVSQESYICAWPTYVHLVCTACQQVNRRIFTHSSCNQLNWQQLIYSPSQSRGDHSLHRQKPGSLKQVFLLEPAARATAFTTLLYNMMCCRTAVHESSSDQLRTSLLSKSCNNSTPSDGQKNGTSQKLCIQQASR